MGVPKDPIKYAEFLVKLSKSHKGQKHSAEWITNSVNGRKQKSTFANKHKGEKLPPRSLEWCQNISLAKMGQPAWNKGHKDLQKSVLFNIRRWFYKLPMRKVKRKTPVLSPEVLQKKILVCKNRVWSKESLKKISISKIGIPRPEHVRQAMLQASIGRVPTEETRKKMAAASQGRLWSEESKQKLREKRKNWKIPYHDTKPERMMQLALELKGIKFVTHKPIKLGNRWHQVDIFIEPNVVVEVDGVHWHLEEQDVKRDLRQTQELTIMGYHVIRIRDKDILNNSQNCAERVIQLIKELQHRHIPLD